jgi:hypothetical protein
MLECRSIIDKMQTYFNLDTWSKMQIEIIINKQKMGIFKMI